MPDCSNCRLEDRVEALERTVEKNREKASETHKEFYERIRAVETKAAVQKEQYNTILEKLDTLTETITNVTGSVSEIKAKPGKNWEDFKGKVIWAIAGCIITAVMAFLLKQVGL